MATRKKPVAKTDTGAHYVVLSNLHHDGVAYAPGDTVMLEPHEAEHLLDTGVVQAAE